MEYLKILLIILIIIIFSYILINYAYTKTNIIEKFSTQLIDDNFKLISSHKNVFNNCDNNICDILFFKKNRSYELNQRIDNENIKYQYIYITDDNNIYLLPCKTILLWKKIVLDLDIKEPYTINAVTMQNNTIYLAIKTNDTKTNYIYYSVNYGSSWESIPIDKKNNTANILYNTDTKITDIIPEKDYINIITSTVTINGNNVSSEISLQSIYLNNAPVIIRYYKETSTISKPVILHLKSYSNNFYLLHKKDLNDNILSSFILVLQKNVLDDIVLYKSNNDMPIILDLKIYTYKLQNNKEYYTILAKNIDNSFKIFNNIPKLFINKIVHIFKDYQSFKDFIDTIDIDSNTNVVLDSHNGKNIELTVNNTVNYSLVKNYPLNYNNNIYVDNILYIDNALIFLSNINYFKLFNLSSEYFTNTIVDYLFNTTTNNITIFDDKENMYISKYLLDVNKFSSFDKVSYFNNEIVSESKLNEYIKLEASSQISIINYDFVNYLYSYYYNKIKSNKLNYNINISNIYNYAFYMINIKTDKIIFDGESIQHIDNLYANDKTSYLNIDNNYNDKEYIIEFNNDIYADILLIGGGGAGGKGGGGGGSGDVKLYQNVEMTKGKYKIVIGSGGKSIENNNTDENISNGNNTYIEKIDNSKKFRKLIAAGGAAGTSYLENINNRPNESGEKGTIYYSSGAGGGAGGNDKIGNIGGLGNIVSGNGGSSFFNDESRKLYYGGGGGSSGLDYNSKFAYNFNKFKNEKNDGKSASEDNLGIGGESLELPENFKYNAVYHNKQYNINKITKGGDGGVYTNNPSIELIEKLKIFNDNITEYIPGSGGNGSVLIGGENYYPNRKIDGTNGLVILLGSTKNFENDKSDVDTSQSNSEMLNYYSLKDRDLDKENIELINLNNKRLIERIREKQFKKEKEIMDRKQYKKNVNEIESIRNKLIMDNYTLDNRNSSINDPINDSYLPYHNTYTKKDTDATDPLNNILRFKIISLYKELLQRQPTENELESNKRKIESGILKLETLKRHIINSDEYLRTVKLQSNSINPELVYSATKRTIITKIGYLYKLELNEEAPDILLAALKDVYHYLQYNEYLLRAMFINPKFSIFKRDIMEDKSLRKNDIIALFNNYFDLNELKNKANDIQRYDKYHKQNIEPNKDKAADLTGVNLNDLVLQDDYKYELWRNTDSDFSNTSNITLKDRLRELEKLRQTLDDSFTKIDS